jgi:hypothetical protein
MNHASISYLTTLAVKAGFLDAFDAQRLRVAFANGSVNEDKAIEQMLTARDNSQMGGLGSITADIGFCKLINHTPYMERLRANGRKS